MEKDEIKESQVVNELEETETQDEILENADEVNEKNTSSKVILANALDQLIMVAVSSVLIFLIDLILRKAFGYMFVRENGAIILAAGIIYFVINCIYAPIMEKTKLENTLAKKILDLN